MTQANPTLDGIWQLFQETDRKLQETERLMKESTHETNCQIKQLSKNLGDIGNRLGEFVAHMVLPTVVQSFRREALRFTKCIPMFPQSATGKADCGFW